jgi:hypothetical protein
MMDKRAELTAVADALTAGGVAAGIDPRDLTPPAAWVRLGLWEYDRLSADCVSAQLVVDLFAPDIGVEDALGLLDQLEADTVTILGPPVGPVVQTTAQLPDSTALLPCYRLTYDVGLS